MEVVLVQARRIAVIRELNLELQLVAAHGPLANGAPGADAWPSPRAIGSLGGNLAGLDCRSGALAENSLVWHVVGP
jgi:hypothetical protein